MSYDMSFKGAFEYESPAAARHAVEAFAKAECIEESVVTPDDLRVDQHVVRVDVEASAPATWWESTNDTLAELSETATGGHVDAVYDSGEGPEFLFRVRLLPGGDEEELDD